MPHAHCSQGSHRLRLRRGQGPCTFNVVAKNRALARLTIRNDLGASFSSSQQQVELLTRADISAPALPAVVLLALSRAAFASLTPDCAHAELDQLTP